MKDRIDKKEECWHACHECQMKRGARAPKGGHVAITVMIGTCPICKKEEVTLIPTRDYVWTGKIYLWD